jgi:hypothetical protein
MRFPYRLSKIGKEKRKSGLFRLCGGRRQHGAAKPKQQASEQMGIATPACDGSASAAVTNPAVEWPA